MQTHTTAPSLTAALAGIRRSGASIGLVPTMGALHAGPLSLVAAARAQCDVVVVSLFVNPLQFGPSEDFARYPRDPAGDAQLLAGAGVDHLFAPSAPEMYPAGSVTRIEVGPIGDVGEGRFRPGFFTGVATVCCKLCNIVGPDRAYFGEKDAQQLAVIRQVVADLNLPLAVVGCPTLREPDGLAMSSRNAYLSPAERAAAPALAVALAMALASGERSVPALRAMVAARVAEEPLLRLQYADAFDAATWQPVDVVDRPAVLALAAFAGETRLIDNVVLPAPAAPGAAEREGILVAG